MKLLSSLLFLILSSGLSAQESTGDSGKFSSLNSVQLELLGPAGIYSLNYERVLWNGSGWKTAAQVGLSFFGNQNWKGMNFPIAITQLKSFGNHHLEVGVGALPNVVLYSSNAHEEPPQNLNGDIYFNGRIGYRFQNPERHFIFRAGYTPIVYPEFGHWGGIAFGWTF